MPWLYPQGQIFTDNASVPESEDHAFSVSLLVAVFLRRNSDFAWPRNRTSVRNVRQPGHGNIQLQVQAGAKVGNSIDAKTGIPIVSLYGAKNQPSEEDMSLFDVLLVDIQDGCHADGY